MKDLLVTNDFPPGPGGVARWYGQLCASAPVDRLIVLAPRGHDDRTFDPAQRYRIIRKRISTKPNPVFRLIQIIALLWHTFGIMLRERIYTVHIGHLHLGPIGLAVNVVLGRSYILYLHGGEMAPYLGSRIIRAVVRVIIGRARMIVVNSEFTRRHYEALGLGHTRTEVFKASVPTDRFRPDIDASHIRARFGLNGESVLLTVGRLVERKGHDMVIRALPALKERVGPVRYLVAGTGPEATRLRAVAAEMECEKDVIFAGYVQDEDLPSLYAACDIFVMPSRALHIRDGIEGYGIVFLEAASCGKPAVAGRSGGSEEAVLDGVTGLLVDPNDPKSIGAAIASVLLDKDLTVRLGRQAREHAIEREGSWHAKVGKLWEKADGYK